MYVHESGVGYTLYIQNNKYANQVLEEREAEASGTVINKPYDSSLHDYLEKVIAAIPELKEYEANGGGIGVVILPESASSTLKEAVSQTTDKMLKEGEYENILKGVLGIIKYNYSGDVEYGNGVATSKNDVFTYDLESVNNVLNKFKDIYASNGALSASLGKFSEYLSEIYEMLQKKANPKNETETAASEAKNELVDTLIQELEKSQDDTIPGPDQLNKALYKKYIKSLISSLKSGLLQQHG
jgi:hypothetical protein